MSISGGCLCGAVRYETAEPPRFVGNCYCGTCRKESGAGHITIVMVPTAALTLSGPLTEYAQPRAASEPPIPRFFCSTCATTVFARPPMLPGATMLRAGTIDDASGLEIEASVFVSQAQPWDLPPVSAPCFAEGPEF